MSLFRPKREVRNFIGDPTFNPFERPSMPLASLALDGVLGQGWTNDSGQNVNPLAGMSLPTVYACISVISTQLASCVLEEIDNHGEASPWTAFQNLDSHTPFEITQLMATHLGAWGNFYALKVMLNGRLVDLQPLFPGNVSVLMVRGQKIFRVRKQNESGTLNVTLPDGGNGPQVQYTDYTEDDVLHIPFMGYDGIQGMSPIMLMANTIGTAIGADRLAARFHRSGQQLGGIINVKAPLADQDQADQIKWSWQNAHGGVSNSGNVAVLDAETTFTPITINPDDLQLLDSREWSAQEIARMYGVPLTMLSFAQTGYGDAIETQQVGFVNITLRKYADPIEQRLSREFMVRGRCVKFNFDALLRGTMAERYGAYNLAITGGWMQPAEARENENMVEKPGLSYFQEPTVQNGQLTNGPLTPNGEPMAAPAPAPTEPDDSDDDSEDDNTDD